jgi:hypothetical protein
MLLINCLIGDYFQKSDSDDAKMYMEVAGGIDDIPFGITHDATVAKALELTKDGIVMFKKVGLCCSIIADRIVL